MKIPMPNAGPSSVANTIATKDLAAMTLKTPLTYATPTEHIFQPLHARPLRRA
jgi:hypothetical protein